MKCGPHMTRGHRWVWPTLPHAEWHISFVELISVASGTLVRSRNLVDTGRKWNTLSSGEYGGCRELWGFSFQGWCSGLCSMGPCIITHLCLFCQTYIRTTSLVLATLTWANCALTHRLLSVVYLVHWRDSSTSAQCQTPTIPQAGSNDELLSGHVPGEDS